MLDFESGFIDDEPPRRRRVRYLKKPHSEESHDLEMGIFPAIAAAIPMVASLAGSLMSKKSSKGGGPPPEAGTANNVLDVLTKAIGGDEGQSIQDVVRNIVATVPSPVLRQVKDGIKQVKNSGKAAEAARDLIVKKVDHKFGPQIHALLAAAKAAQVQRQATFEHNVIKTNDAFRKGTTSTLSNIDKRLAFIEARLAKSAVVQGEERMRIYGGRTVLER